MFVVCMLLCWNISAPAVEYLRIESTAEHLPGSQLTVIFDVSNDTLRIDLQLIHDSSENYFYDPEDDLVIHSQEVTVPPPHIRQELPIPADLPDGAYLIRLVENPGETDQKAGSVYVILRQGKLQRTSLSELFQKSSLASFNPPKNSYFRLSSTVSVMKTSGENVSKCPGHHINHCQGSEVQIHEISHIAASVLKQA